MVSRASRIARRLGPRTCRAGAVAERRRALFDVPLRRTTERVAQPSRCEAYVRSSHSAEQAGLTIQHPSHHGQHRMGAPVVSQGVSSISHQLRRSVYFAHLRPRRADVSRERPRRSDRRRRIGNLHILMWGMGGTGPGLSRTTAASQGCGARTTDRRYLIRSESEYTAPSPGG